MSEQKTHEETERLRDQKYPARKEGKTAGKTYETKR